MTRIERSKVLILLSAVAFAAMLSGLYVTTYATNTTENPYKAIGARLGFGGGGMMLGRPGHNGFVEVSAQYNQTVINIVKSDSDVKKLLADGYTISAVRPIIKSIVQADGSIVTKAANAIVILVKDTTGRASVDVDVANAKVTRIVIQTRTVIQK